MIYDVRQITTYAYTEAVPFGRHVARLLPRPWDGQRILSASLAVEPKASDVLNTEDYFGNRIRFFTLDQPHKRLSVTLRARIEVAPPKARAPGATPAWEAVRAAARDSVDLSAHSPAHFLFDSRLVSLSDEIGEYAAPHFPVARPVLEGALSLMNAIKADFTYESGATDAATPPQDAFASRKGVCQDFAHIMIAGLRWLGLPAAYVSGYLRTRPPEGKSRLEGCDATHAWVQVWCGAETGWVGLDPTNAMLAGEDHLLLAVGRDYADVAPLDGVIVASGQQKLEVAVDVIPVEGRDADLDAPDHGTP